MFSYLHAAYMYVEDGHTAEVNIIYATIFDDNAYLTVQRHDSYQTFCLFLFLFFVFVF